MKFLHRLLCAAALAMPGAALAAAGAYEATLPPGLDSAADMCALLPCAEVLPGATRFSERKGQPPYVEGSADGKLVGYVMLSTDITDTPAYSGKPVVTLIGMDTAGRFTGIKVLKHSEPILLLGIPESALVRFNDQYKGKSVTDKIEVGPARPEESVLGVDAISGATVTVIAQNQVLMTSAIAVAKQVGILAPTVREPARYVDPAPGAAPPDWGSLVKSGAVQRLVVRPEQVGLARSSEPFIELWFGSLNSPLVGRALLGEAGWRGLMDRLGKDDNAIFIIRTAGAESFKGSGFVRGGLYDRIQVRQDGDTFTFRDTDYLNLYGLEAAGAPSFSESAIFIVRAKAFSAAYPWKLNFLGNRVDRATGARTFANFQAEYWLPAAALQGGRPVVQQPEAAWVKVWKARAGSIAAFAALLLAVAIVYANRDRLTRRSTHRNKWPVNGVKYAIWAIFVGWVGMGLLAQPSITQLLTWFHSLLFKWQWELFLSDPFIFLFWIFIIVTTFVWGRGLFCGWTCPFGALQEGLHKLAHAIGLGRWQRKPSERWHARLKWVKYVVFIGLLAVSMGSMGLAEVLAEVEPFKTTFLVGPLNRSWPYITYLALLLGLAIVIERPFCKYLCPLGGALAMPTTFRWFGLVRKPDCNHCKSCARACGSLAIDTHGRIDQRECLACMDCMILYTDARGCLPLGQERMRRERAGEPLTPIGRDGYFIPIKPVPANGDAHPVKGVDPRLPTERVTPPYAAPGNTFAWLVGEVRDHLWPWSGASFKRLHAIEATGVSVAIAASAAWGLAATGQLSSGAIIAWWFGWSLYEVVIRMLGKRHVKDGPWWGRTWRRATWMDMLSYVGFKNLLVGATLYLALRTLGWLPA